MSPTALAVLLALLPWTAQALTQVPPDSETFGEVISVREVLVDALVTDKLGNVVRGLGPADFKLVQSGKQTNVGSVRFYDCLAPGLSPKAAEDPLAPRPERRFFLLLSGLSPARAQAVLPRVRRWITDDLQVWDLVAVAHLEGKLVVQQTFLLDREPTIEAIARWGGDGAPVAGADSAAVLSALDELAVAAGPIQRRKNLVLFVDSFEGRLDATRLASTLRALNSSGIAVYVLDLGASRAGRGSLRRLAEGTSGQLLTASGDVLIPLQRILLENAGYYLLSFVPAEDQSGDQHVKVEMRDGRYRVAALPRQRALPGKETF